MIKNLLDRIDHCFEVHFAQHRDCPLIRLSANDLIMINDADCYGYHEVLLTFVQLSRGHSLECFLTTFDPASQCHAVLGAAIVLFKA